MKHKAIFITGTDTGIGKTFYTCRLLESLNAEGYSTLALKPVAAGAIEVGGVLKNDDALQLQQAASVDIPYQDVNPYCFELPIAPHLAATKESREIDLKLIRDQYLKLNNKADIVVVEGVGGWQVPLNDSCTVADLAGVLQLPVVMVVGMRLGCINHALLTANSIQQSSLPFVGWVANVIDTDMSALDENVKTLQQLLQIPLLDVIQFQANTPGVSFDSPKIDWLKNLL